MSDEYNPWEFKKNCKNAWKKDRQVFIFISLMCLGMLVHFVEVAFNTDTLFFSESFGQITVGLLIILIGWIYIIFGKEG